MKHANAHRLQTGRPIRHSRGAMVLEGPLCHFPTCLTIQELIDLSSITLKPILRDRDWSYASGASL